MKPIDIRARRLVGLLFLALALVACLMVNARSQS